MNSVFQRELRQEWQLATLSGQRFIESVCFFMLLVFFLRFGSDEILTHTLWVGFVLAMGLAGDWAFASETEDNALFYRIIAANHDGHGHAMFVWIWAKALVYALLWGGPLILISALIMAGAQASVTDGVCLILMILLSMFWLIWVGFLGSAFTLLLDKAGMLKAVLVFPLYVPMLVLGFISLDALSYLSSWPWGWLGVMGSLSFLLSMVLPFAIVALLRCTAGER